VPLPEFEPPLLCLQPPGMDPFVDGMPEPGLPVLGAVAGGVLGVGEAAITTAAPPPTSISPATVAARILRRMPIRSVGCSAGCSIADSVGTSVVGPNSGALSSYQFTIDSLFQLLGRALVLRMVGTRTGRRPSRRLRGY